MAEDLKSSLDHAFVKVCDLFGFSKLNKHQEEAIRYVVEMDSDVYVNLPTGYGKSVVFQALPTVFESVDRREKNIVIVISPLINLMKDQVSRWCSRGVRAISLRDVSTEVDIIRVESGGFSVVYGSPESWLGDTRWRKMLTSEIYKSFVRAVAVDEAHVICHWGKSKSNKHTAFRVWFSRLHELRSLLPRTPFIALTATATKDTREVIFEVLLMKDPCIVEENPNKANISYIVHYMERNASLSDYFHWIAKEVIDVGSMTTRTIIYCQTIKQCAVVYSTLKALIGDNIYVNPESKDSKRVILEMLHSCSPQSNKDLILESFQCDEGDIRILVATIAFGMGVDCKAVHRTIHFGPAKNIECYMQESGRAGRDGSQCTAYLLYQGMQLVHVDQDIKSYIKSKGCRRKHLLHSFDVECPQQTPAHLCCDNCSLTCKCGVENCKPLAYPLCRDDEHHETQRQRLVTSEQKKTLESKLSTYHKQLHTNLLQRDASGKMKFFTNLKFLLGFSEIQIQQVVEHCNELFSILDIYNLIEIWDLQHAYKIHAFMQEIFGDMSDHEMISEDEFSDEETDFLGSDWSDLAVDNELANMVIDNLSFSQWDESVEESVECEQDDTNVPFAALNAVFNLSFDAVLDH